MQHRLVTEYEWRKRAQRPPKARPDWWGAQCLYPVRGYERLKRDRSFHIFLLMCSLMTALILPVLVSAPVKAEFPDGAVEMTEEEPKVRKVSAVAYQQPMELQYQQVTFTREQLLRGKMLLLDETHPLPDDILPPNTASIAAYGRGMVPVRSLTLKTGRETIDALVTLFGQLRERSIDGLYVSAAATTAAEQRKCLVELVRAEMKTSTPSTAVMKAWQQQEPPGTGVLMQEYAVELRFIQNGVVDERMLDATQQGQALLQLIWRHGFVRAAANRPFRFRYVGKAHAAAITYLDLDFAEYLEWLHQKGIISISAGGELQYLILCRPINGEYVAFDLPIGAQWEASLDNTGYAVVACTF